MTGYSEYDPIGELFRQRLENHRIPVNGNGWDEIEHRMSKRKNKIVIWLWSAGAVAAAASIAVLLIFKQPITNEATLMAVSTEESGNQSFNDSITTSGELASPVQKFNDSMIVVNELASSAQKLPPANSQARFNDSMIESSEFASSVQLLTSQFNDSVNQLISHPVISEKEIPQLDVSLVADNPEEDETATKKTDKWLLVAAFGISGYANDFSNDAYAPSISSVFSEWGLSGSNNKYATDMSGSIRSFNYMSREEFTNISHRPPFSFGLTARKSLGNRGGVESGLVYTYLASSFKWSGYNVHQSLHYVGVPFNMVVYLWNSKPNWRIYLSGGVMVEKGLRGIYRQEMQMWSEHRTTTVKSSSIDGWQWSLNSALGINYRLEKGWGIYFEPRVGYSFDCNQPVSIRTEWPMYVGVNLGLNYEL